MNGLFRTIEFSSERPSAGRQKSDEASKHVGRSALQRLNASSIFQLKLYKDITSESQCQEGERFFNVWFVGLLV